MSQIRIVKRKATGFFKPEDIPIIKETVQDVHSIISNASILVRAFCIDKVSNNPLTTRLEVDHQIFSYACNIVQGDCKPIIRGDIAKPENKTKVALFQELYNIYGKLYGDIQPITTKYSVSHILAYSIENILTAYKNNVVAHFPKYPRKLILCDLLNHKYPKQDAKRISSIINNHFMYDGSLEGLETMKNVEDYPIDVQHYSNLYVDKQTVKGLPRCWDLKVDPWLYLPKMIKINQMMETDYKDLPDKVKKLYNPLPLHSSFVPMHIRLDTSGLAQLLMTQEKIKDFKNLYEIEHPKESLNMHSKANMLSSFEKIFGRKENSKEEGGLFATSLWDYMTNLTSCKQYKELYTTRKNDPNNVVWVFDNAVITDGVSMSFQVIDKSVFGRKTLTGRKKDPLSVDELEEFEEMKPITLEGHKVLGCDPGKKDILTITDGQRTITYTKGQRNQDVLKKTREQLLIARKKKIVGLESYETTVMNQHCKRSCCFDSFKGYCIARKAKERELAAFYNQPVFRQFKYLNYCKTKSSELRFIDRVTKTFCCNINCQKKSHCMNQTLKDNLNTPVQERKDIVIAWGNWGARPNALKGCCPTPGIGIRRRFSSYFKTVTINEYLTSQRCPCCHGTKCLKKHRDTNNIERHHLLRCTNDQCQSRWWNRNVVGSFNILYKALHPMETFGEEKTKKTRKKTASR